MRAQQIRMTTNTTITTSSVMTEFYERCRAHYLEFKDVDTMSQYLGAFSIMEEEFGALDSTTDTDTVTITTIPTNIETDVHIETPCYKCKKEAFVEDDRIPNFRISNGEHKNPARFEWLSICIDCVKIESTTTTCFGCGVQIRDPNQLNCIMWCSLCDKDKRISLTLLADPAPKVSTHIKRRSTKRKIEFAPTSAETEPNVDSNDDEFSGFPTSFQTPVKSAENSTTVVSRTNLPLPPPVKKLKKFVAHVKKINVERSGFNKRQKKFLENLKEMDK